MCRSPLVRGLGAAVLMAAVAGAGSPARAADTEFHWSADTSAGYSGNVFYSEGNKVGSWGGAVRANLGWSAKTRRSEFDVTYSPDYYWYDTGEGTNNLGHALSSSWKLKQSERIDWRAGVRGNLSEEQQYDVENAAQGITVTERSRRTNWDADVGTAIRATDRLTFDVGLGYGQMNHGHTSFGGATQQLVDGDHQRASLGLAYRVTPTGHLNATYTYTEQGFSPSRFTENELQLQEDVNGDGTIGLDANGILPEATFLLDETRTHGLNLGYGWQISEKSFGQVGGGLFRTQFRSRSGADTNWGINASATHQLTARLSTQVGASRDVSSFWGLGGSAVGEIVWATFTIQAGRDASLVAGANWTRRKEFENNGSSVETAAVRATWTQRIGRWGGYSISYDLADQTLSEGDQGRVRTAELSNAQNVRFDVVRMGLFFKRAGQGAAKTTRKAG